ncbi:sigma-70 family RNA polymerase sigma factor [Virgibacillus flavescens]|uniref:sigma-70 family RNA polymerase sigma factor n=1 Tax=Virgibacillus flavescens TaxID=1611422 RepID=UPI003D32F2A4
MHDDREQQGDKSNRELLVELMESYGDMVIRVAFTYVKERHLAEDISQEVFIRCYQSIDSFENRSSYKSWLYRITVNCCKDYLRSWSFRNLIPNALIKDNGRFIEALDNQVMEKEENDLLFEQVLKLSVKLREVLIFYYYEDLTVDETANVLKVNPDTVKSRLFRARKAMKNLIEGGMVFEK